MLAFIKYNNASIFLQRIKVILASIIVSSIVCLLISPAQVSTPNRSLPLFQIAHSACHVVLSCEGNVEVTEIEEGLFLLPIKLFPTISYFLADYSLLISSNKTVKQPFLVNYICSLPPPFLA